MLYEFEKNNAVLRRFKVVSGLLYFALLLVCGLLMTASIIFKDTFPTESLRMVLFAVFIILPIVIILLLKSIKIERRMKDQQKFDDFYSQGPKIIKTFTELMEEQKIALRSEQLERYLLLYPPLGQAKKAEITENIRAFQGAIESTLTRDYYLSKTYARWANLLFGNIYKPEKDFKIEVIRMD